MRRLQFLVSLYVFVTKFAIGKAICNQVSNDGTLAFQAPPQPLPNTTLYIRLLYGFSVEIECCLSGLTNFTTIKWEVNGTLLNEYNAVTTFWTLSEQQQVLTVSETGVYVCTATDGQESISKVANVTTFNIDPTCSLGTIGSVLPGYPPTDVYEVGLHTSYSLTCEVVVYCGSLRQLSHIQWSKILDLPGEEDEFVYILYDGDKNSIMDAHTGDWVNVTAWYDDDTRQLLVTTVLNIHNVTSYDLYGENESERNCSGNSSDCSPKNSKHYYQCSIVLEESGDESQSLYSLLKNTRLHSYTAPTIASFTGTAQNEDSSGWRREGIIFGSILGAFFVVVTLVALLYVRYEWHIRVYFKRLAILACSRGKATHQFAYDCYVACASEDESLVFNVLSEQLEKQLGYRLCLPERDFTIGAAIPEQIGSFIEKSEFFLAIISPRFWITDWCNLAMDMALRTNAKVIAVFILDNPKAKADKRPNVVQALKAPGCSEFVIRTWKLARGHDSLGLKLQCAVPRPRSRSHDQQAPETPAVQPTTFDMHVQPTSMQPPTYTSLYGQNPNL